MRACAFLLSEHENAEAFIFAFKFLKEIMDALVEDLPQFENGYKLDYLVTDAGTAILLGLQFFLNANQ